VRTYLAYQTETGEQDYTSFFANAKYKTARIGELSVWLNWGEIDHNRGRLNYWYGYIQSKSILNKNIGTIVKLTHSYRRGEADKHISTVTVGLEAVI
jgi:hypothetical protein